MRLKRLGIYLVLAGLVFLNNWILGIFINNHLFKAGGSVSELSALTQPHELLFRALDVVAGVLLVSGFWILLKQGSRYWFWRGFYFGGLVLGVANCIDALLPLPCSGTVNPRCSSPVHIDLHRISIPDHAISSTAIGLIFLLLPTITLIFAHKIADLRLEIASSLALVAFLVFFATLLITNPRIDSILGYVQEIQVLVFSWLVIELLLRELRRKNAIVIDKHEGKATI